MNKKIFVTLSVLICCFCVAFSSLAYNRTELQNYTKEELIDLVISLTEENKCSLKSPEYCTKIQLVSLIRSAVVERENAAKNALSQVENATEEDDLLTRFGATEIVEDNLPESISFWTEASCPNGGTGNFEYSWIPLGYALANCEKGDIGSHNGCDNCAMAKIELKKKEVEQDTDLIGELKKNIPSSIDAEYIEIYDAPEISIISDSFSCEGEEQEINERKYCISVETGAAAGSSYSEYKYVTNYDEKNIEISFILRATNCEMLDSPLDTVCEKEQEKNTENYYANNIIKNIFSFNNSSSICTDEYAPVCGADGNTYSNKCILEQAGIEFVYDGECVIEELVNIEAITPSSISIKENTITFRVPTDKTFSGATGYAVMCGKVGNNYDIREDLTINGDMSSSSFYKYIKLTDLDFNTTYYCMGQLCKNDECFYGSIATVKTGEDSLVDNSTSSTQETIACTMEYAPVCGADGNTYSNKCILEQAGIEFAYNGECVIQNTTTNTNNSINTSSDGSGSLIDAFKNFVNRLKF